METEYCTPDEFVNLAIEILGNKPYYEDNLVCIQTDHNGLDIQITRKNIPDGPHHVQIVSNPVTMVSGGKIIRHHGEHKYLTKHLKKLAGDKARCV